MKSEMLLLDLKMYVTAEFSQGQGATESFDLRTYIKISDHVSKNKMVQMKVPQCTIQKR